MTTTTTAKPSDEERAALNALEVERIERRFSAMAREYFRTSPNLQQWAKENPANTIPRCYRGES